MFKIFWHQIPVLQAVQAAPETTGTQMAMRGLKVVAKR